MARRYERSPLIEAVCEFRFVPADPWDWTIPGLVWQKLAADYPRKQAKPFLEGAGAMPDLPLDLRGVSRLQFLSESGDRMVQIGSDLLAVNALKPYPGWVTFRDHVLTGLSAYCGVAMPSGLTRIGLRYINRVEVEGPEVDLSRYVRAAPAMPQGLEATVRGFLSISDLDVDGGQRQLRFQLGSAQPERPDTAAFAFDLDMASRDDSAPKLDGVEAWLDRSHELVELAFDATFTDEAHRELFREVPE
jgi:uncharacterized protein (TIGR04255 family)